METQESITQATVLLMLVLKLHGNSVSIDKVLWPVYEYSLGVVPRLI